MKSPLIIASLLALNFLPQLANAQPDWPDQLIFNSTVRLGQEWLPLSLTNDLDDTLTVQGYRSESAVFWLEGLANERRLGPGRTIHLRVFADPDSGGDLESTVTILTDYPNYGEHVVHCDAAQMVAAGQEEVPWMNESDQDMAFRIEVETISAPEGTPDDWVWVEPDSGTVPAHQEIVLTVYYREYEMFGGDYEAVLHIMTDNPDNPVIDWFVNHQMTGVARLDTNPDTLKVSRSDEPPEPGQPYRLDLTLKNIGSDDLEIDDVYSVDRHRLYADVDRLPIIISMFETESLAVYAMPDDSVYSEYVLHIISNDHYWDEETGGYWVTFIADLVVPDSLTVPIPPPSAFFLLEAYPNPFNSTTMIPVVLPVAGRVSLTVYDVFGRRVLVQENDYLVEGEQRIIIDGAGWASGIYFATVASHYGRAAAKLVVLR
jgi:hypothetical protein